MDQLTGPGGGGPQGADVGSTALHLAAGAGHLPVVKMLVSPTKTEDLSHIVVNFNNTLLCFSYVLTQRQEQYIYVILILNTHLIINTIQFLYLNSLTL